MSDEGSARQDVRYEGLKLTACGLGLLAVFGVAAGAVLPPVIDAAKSGFDKVCDEVSHHLVVEPR